MRTRNHIKGDGFKGIKVHFSFTLKSLSLSLSLPNIIPLDAIIWLIRKPYFVFKNTCKIHLILLRRAIKQGMTIDWELYRTGRLMLKLLPFHFSAYYLAYYVVTFYISNHHNVQFLLKLYSIECKMLQKWPKLHDLS